MYVDLPFMIGVKYFTLMQLTTLMAARGEQHLKIMFAVLPPFKLQMENKARFRDKEHALNIKTVTYQVVSRCNWVVKDKQLHRKQTMC
uniref:Uncharacterized protein n=1 Tax=Dromaius novaehollandiae TaxID=8790 RepID=A0A8C4JG23_DRONO